MNIVIIGSVAFDDIVTHHGNIQNAPGGSALYFAAAASLFAHVDIVGVIGDDFPLEELDFLKERGVGTDCLEIIPQGKTFRWGGQYEKDMNKRVTTNLELNVFSSFNPKLNERCRKCDYVFLGNIDPDLQLKVLEQIDSPKLIGADTIECYILDKPISLKKVLKKVNLLVINDSEAQLLTGEHNVFVAAKSLLDFGPKYVVVKKGEHGSMLVTHDSLFVVPAYPIKQVIDPTGAGDTYAGALMGYCARTGVSDFQTLKSAVVYGGIVASFTVEAFSVNTVKNLTLIDIEKRLQYFRTITSF
jgi:sugar/nucleoside kinase (ribokinase family)